MELDIQAVESKLSDVTVTPIPRSQVQNFYNYQQQREQREQQPQIQISAIHHAPRERNLTNEREFTLQPISNGSSVASARDVFSKRERDFLQQSGSSSTASSAAAVVAAATALQYTQQLQAQLALLQQQSNTTALPTSSRAAAANNSHNHSHSINTSNGNNSNNGSSSSSSAAALAAAVASASSSGTQSQLKYPLSTSPIIVTTQTSANITTPMTSTANLPTISSSGVNNGLTKYAQLLAVIEEMGRDIRPTYTGSRSSTERLKRGIVHARILVRECLMETERSARQ